MLPEKKGLQESPEPDVAQFLRRHHVFIRTARDASHQSLFFLGMLYDTTTKRGNAAVAGHRPFALEQVRSLIRGVRVPDEPVYREWEEILAREPSGLTSQEETAVRRAIDHGQEWRAIFKSLDDLATLDDSALRRTLIQFLEDSRSERRLERLVVHWLPGCLTYFRKNLAFLWGIVLLAVVSLKVEAVSSLFWNEGWGVLVPFLLLLVPVAAARSWTLYRRVKTPGVVPFWDLSGLAFRSFRHQALEPGRLIERWPGREPLRREIFKGQVVKILGYVVGWVVAFAAISLLYGSGVLGTSDSSRTVFLILSVFYALLVLSHVVDFWEYLDPQPVRFLMLIVFCFCLVFLLLGYGREFFGTVFLLAALGYFYGYTRDRHSPFRLFIGLFLLALGLANFKGRDTHARAVWQEVEKPWSRLAAADWPWPGKPDGSGPPVVVIAASGGGTRAAFYTALALQQLNEEYPQIAAQLQAISSVSGGSLANAAYISRLLEAQPRSADPQEVKRARQNLLGDLEDAVSKDFLFPTIVGAVTPGLTRGQSIEKNWREREVGLGDLHLSDLAARWREERGNSPLPLFNTATLDGHDVVISPLEKLAYVPDEMHREALDPALNPIGKTLDDDSYTWVYYRDGIYGLEDLLSNFDPLLSQAVRASANFPFGFPLVRIETEKPLFFSPRGNYAGVKTVDLTDGGALSNSGMWSLYHLLMPDEQEKRDSLRKRGILLIVIEASKMPSYPTLEQSLNSLWSTIGDQGPVGQHLHRLMFDSLEKEYGDQLAIVQLDLIPQESYNVLTSWALDRRSLATLRRSFARRWANERKVLEASWRILHDRERRGDEQLVARARPPLD